MNADLIRVYPRKSAAKYLDDPRRVMISTPHEFCHGNYRKTACGSGTGRS